MSAARPSFDRLARRYRLLEYLAFGRELERARFAFLDRIADRRDILLLGEGDGRCAGRLAALAPDARLVCVDSSPAMIGRAARRVAATNARGRVSFTCADLLSYCPEAGRFDAVVTLFFLDCFDEAEVASIISRVAPALQPGAPWLFADFTLPESGIARVRARVWLAILYTFFRWETGLRVSSLPPSEVLLVRAGWRRVACRDYQWGLIRSAVFNRHSDRRGPITGARSASA
jgi:ubiquinone/menaquinone biosynthesis C-methylase UbiE